MKPSEYRAQIESSIADIAEWSDEKALIVYRLLHISRPDCRMEGIDDRIERRIRAKCDQG